MDFKRNLLSIVTMCFAACLNVFGRRTRNRILATVSGELAPVLTQSTVHGDISFFCPGTIPEISGEDTTQ